MKTINTNDRVMFYNHKGTVKFGTVMAKKQRLIQDEYEDILIVETADGRTFIVDESHIIESYEQ